MTGDGEVAPPYGILGPLRVDVGDGEIAVGGPKPRAALIRLLLDPGTLVSVDALVDAVWEERAPTDAVKNIQIYVARMRKVLPNGLVASGPGGYLADCRTDDLDSGRYDRCVELARTDAAAGRTADALCRYRAADALWRGDVLADVRYPTFAQAAIAYYEQLRTGPRGRDRAATGPG